MGPRAAGPGNPWSQGPKAACPRAIPWARAPDVNLGIGMWKWKAYPYSQGGTIRPLNTGKGALATVSPKALGP